MATVQVIHATVDLKVGEAPLATRKVVLVGDLTAPVMARVLLL